MELDCPVEDKEPNIFDYGFSYHVSEKHIKNQYILRKLQTAISVALKTVLSASLPNATERAVRNFAIYCW